MNKANGLRYDACSPPPNEFFTAKNFKDWKKSIDNHFNKTSFYVIVVDLKTRGITGQNAQMVKDHLATFTNSSKKIIIIE